MNQRIAVKLNSMIDMTILYTNFTSILSNDISYEETCEIYIDLIKRWKMNHFIKKIINPNEIDYGLMKKS
jgi:hypothetical protein